MGQAWKGLVPFGLCLTVLSLIYLIDSNFHQPVVTKGNNFLLKETQCVFTKNCSHLFNCSWLWEGVEPLCSQQTTYPPPSCSTSQAWWPLVTWSTLFERGWTGFSCNVTFLVCLLWAVLILLDDASYSRQFYFVVWIELCVWDYSGHLNQWKH